MKSFMCLVAGFVQLEFVTGCVNSGLVQLERSPSKTRARLRVLSEAPLHALRLLRTGVDLIKDHDTRDCVRRADAPPGATPASNKWYEECWKVGGWLWCGVALSCSHRHVMWNHTQAASDGGAWSTVMLPGGGHAIGVDENKLRALPFVVLLGIVQRFRCVTAIAKAPLVRVVQYVDLPFAVTEKYAPMQVRAIKELVSQGKIGATFAQPSMDESVADAFSLVVQVLMSAFPRCLAC